MRKIIVIAGLLWSIGLCFEAPTESGILLDKTEVRVLENGRVQVDVHFKAWISNQKDNKLAILNIVHSSDTKIGKLSAWRLDEKGKRKDKFLRKDFRRANYSRAGIHWDDTKYIHLDASQSLVPYGVEFIYSLEYPSHLYWPEWIPESEYPVLLSEYILSIPDGLDYLSHRNSELIGEPVNEDGKLVWRAENLFKIERDYAGPPWPDLFARLSFVAKKCDFYGTQLSCESWQSVGEWAAELNRGRRDLTELPNNFTVDSTASLWERINNTYQYVQNSTRYVGIELRLGSFQPHPCSWVQERAYGDCKDLAGYLVNLLSLQGITAHTALVKTRTEGEVIPELPSNTFNHVIAVVPFEGDSIWVDCTTENFAFGQVPRQDQGTWALVVKEGASTLQRIPLDAAHENQRRFVANASLSGRGDLALRGTFSFTGIKAPYFRSLWLALDEKKRWEMVQSMLADDNPNFTLESLEAKNEKAGSEPFIISFSGLATGYGNRTGSRLFFKPNFYARWPLAFEKPEKRKQAVFNSYPDCTLDSLTITLPPGFSIEFIPENKTADNKHVSYSYQLDETEGRVTLVRKHTRHSREIPLEDYWDFFDQRKLMSRTDQGRIVLLKK